MITLPQVLLGTGSKNTFFFFVARRSFTSRTDTQEVLELMSRLAFLTFVSRVHCQVQQKICFHTQPFRAYMPPSTVPIVYIDLHCPYLLDVSTSHHRECFCDREIAWTGRLRSTIHNALNVLLCAHRAGINIRGVLGQEPIKIDLLRARCKLSAQVQTVQ